MLLDQQINCVVHPAREVPSVFATRDEGRESLETLESRAISVRRSSRSGNTSRTVRPGTFCPLPLAGYKPAGRKGAGLVHESNLARAILAAARRNLQAAERSDKFSSIAQALDIDFHSSREKVVG